MSYALRNSLILLGVLLLLGGLGWGYIHFYQKAEIEELEGELATLTTEMNEKQAIADQFEIVLARVEAATDFINGFDKSLYPSSDEDRVYEFLQTVSRNLAYTDFNFAFSDSTAGEDFGIMRVTVTGDGYYRNVINFLRHVELGKPIHKVRELSIDPINDLENYGRITYTFRLESYYDRSQLLDQELGINTRVPIVSVSNPFYPLIRDVPPNEDQEINVESSKLVAVSGSRIFLLDQGGALQRLSVGDSVWLGRLVDIDLKEGTATFQLNKGGIVERITLEVQQ